MHKKIFAYVVVFHLYKIMLVTILFIAIVSIEILLVLRSDSNYCVVSFGGNVFAEGVERVTPNGFRFCAYTGIPYSIPPIGNYRFEVIILTTVIYLKVLSEIPINFVRFGLNGYTQKVRIVIQHIVFLSIRSFLIVFQYYNGKSKKCLKLLSCVFFLYNLLVCLRWTVFLSQRSLLT